MPPTPFALPCLDVDPPYGREVRDAIAATWNLDHALLQEIEARVNLQVRDAVMQALYRADVPVHAWPTCHGRPVRVYGEDTGEGIEDRSTCERCRATKRVIERGAGPA